MCPVAPAPRPSDTAVCDGAQPGATEAAAAFGAAVDDAVVELAVAEVDAGVEAEDVGAAALVGDAPAPAVLDVDPEPQPATATAPAAASAQAAITSLPRQSNLDIRAE